MHSSDALPLAFRVVAGASVFEITRTAHGVVVGCPGCGVQHLFPLDEEPVVPHATWDCPVFLHLASAYRAFHATRREVG